MQLKHSAVGVVLWSDRHHRGSDFVFQCAVLIVDNARCQFHRGDHGTVFFGQTAQAVRVFFRQDLGQVGKNDLVFEFFRIHL